MAVRDFDGVDDRIELSPGSALPTDQTGDITLAAVVKTREAASARGATIWLGATGTNSTGLTLETFDEDWAYLDDNNEFDSQFFSIVADVWQLVAATRDATTGQVRWHRYNWSTDTWEHVDGGTVATPPSGGNDSHLNIGEWGDGTGDILDALLAVSAVFPAVLSDAEIETLISGTQAWLDLNPSGLWELAQEDVSTAVEDLAENGADQVGITGTSVVTDDDPPDFTFLDTGGTTVELAAALEGAGALTADLEVTRLLASTLQGQGDLTAALEVTRLLEAGLAGEGSLAASLEVVRELAASLEGTGELAATLEVSRLLAAALAGEGDLAGDLEVERLLSASLQGEGSLAASLEVERLLSAALSGEGQLDGSLLVERLLQASLQGTGTLEATLDTSSAVLLAATLQGQGQVDAALEVTRLLGASLEGAGDVGAQLEVERRLSAALEGEGQVEGELTVERLLSASLQGAGSLEAALEIGEIVSGFLVGEPRTYPQLSGRPETDAKLGGTPETRPRLTGRPELEGDED